MSTFEATVRAVVRETWDTVSLWLETGSPHAFRAGQFLSLDPHRQDFTRGRARELEALKGRKEKPRAYSLASAPHEELVAITVKEEPAGEFPSLMSPGLSRSGVGEKLFCTGYAGLFTLPEDLGDGAHVVHLCAGSGIVPSFAILKDALHRGVDARHTLLYSNKRWEDVIFRDALTELETRHPGSLRVVHALTRDARAPAPARREVRPGRIDEATLRANVPDLENAWFYVCGPSVPIHEARAARERGEKPAPRFLESMRALVLSLGIPKERLFTEGW